MPASISSSLKRCIASHISGVGRMPFSLSSVAFTSTITRIVCLPIRAGSLSEPAASAWYRNDERGRRKPTSCGKFCQPVEARGANGRWYRTTALSQAISCACCRDHFFGWSTPIFASDRNVISGQIVANNLEKIIIVLKEIVEFDAAVLTKNYDALAMNVANRDVLMDFRYSLY